MKNKKLFRILCLLGIFFIVSCHMATAQTQSPLTVINLWHALPAENSELFSEIVHKYIKETHGTVGLNIKRFNTMEELHTALLNTSQPPDIALIDTCWQDVLAEKHRVVNVEDLILKHGGSSILIVFRADTFKPMWNACLKGKKLMTMPFTGVNRALIVDQDLLDKKGITKVPGVWDDFVVLGQALNKSDGSGEGAKEKTWAFLIPTKESSEKVAEFYQVLLWQTGKDLFEPFMGGELAAFDGPEGRMVLKRLVDKVQTKRISPGDYTDTKNVATFIGTPEEYMKMVKYGKNMKVVKWPINKTSANDLTVYAFMVFDNNDQSKFDKIWHLLYDSCEFQSNLQWSLSTNFLPFNHQITVSPRYLAHMDAYPGIRTYIQQMKHSKTYKTDEKKQKVMNILGQNIIMALNNKMSPDAALEDAAKQADLILDPEGKYRTKRAQMKSVNKYIDKIW